MYKYFGAVVALSLAILLPGAASASPPLRHHKAPAAGQSIDLYSARARRRARHILELKLLEMRKAHLERVRAVIEKRLKPDALFDDRPGALPD